MTIAVAPEVHFTGSREEISFWGSEYWRLREAYRRMEEWTPLHDHGREWRDRMLHLLWVRQQEAEKNHQGACWEAEEQRHASED